MTFAATWMDLKIIVLSEVSQMVRHQHQMLSLYMQNIKKEYNELLYRTVTDSDFEKLMVSKGDSLWGQGDALGVWDGNPIKLDCNDHCTTTNVINSLSNKKIE